MKVLFRLERIGDDSIEAVRAFDRLFAPATTKRYMRARQMSGAHYGAPGVWSLDCLGHPLTELRFRKDYSSANSVGSRGVYAEYHLDAGAYYFVIKRASWKSRERFYIVAKPDGVSRVTEEEAQAWAKKRSVQTS